MNEYSSQSIARQQPHRSGWTRVMYAAILIFTTMGTWEIVHLVSDVTGWALIIRQVAAVIFTDGALLYHHMHQERYPTERQRKISNTMLWESVAVVSALTVCYMLLSVLGDAWRSEMWSIEAPGLTISATAVQWIDIVMLLFLAAQAIANLAALVRISQLSPESSQTLAERQAEQEVITQQLRDYRTAQRVIAPIVGQERALLATQHRLEELGYTPREIALIIAEARTHISDTRALLPATHSPTSTVVVTAHPAPNGNGHKKEYAFETVEAPTNGPKG
jgi:hypothetical protein